MCRLQHFLLVFMWLPGEVVLQSLSDCGPSAPEHCIAAEPFEYGTIGQPKELSVQYVIPSGFTVSLIALSKPRDDPVPDIQISLITPPNAPIIGGAFQGDVEVTDTGTADTRTLTLNILAVAADDLDRYTTLIQYAGDDIFVATTTAMLAVPVPPNPILTISGYTTGVSAGQSLPLTCTSTQGKPPAQVTWWKSDVEQQQAVYSNTPDASNQGDAMSVLTLAVQPANNQETYQCRVSQLGTEKGRQDLQLNVRFLTGTPSLTGHTNPVNSGSSLTLTCTSGNSNPPASITWTRVGGAAPTGTDQPQADGQHGGKITSQQISLTNLQAQDNGAQFKCTATNSQLGQNHSLDSSTVSINVRFYLEGSSITGYSGPVTSGSSLTLTCTSGSSNPPATITWTRVGGAAPTGTDQPQTDGQHGGKITSQQIRLTNLQARDNGAQFKCTVTNPAVSGSEEKTVTIDVQYAPTNAQVTCNPSDLSDLREGGRLVCTCTADSNPAAQFSWIKDSTTGPLPTGAVVDSTAGTLTFSSLDRTHSGEYSCTANNGISPEATSSGITVNVKYAPVQPTIVSNATTVEEGDSIHLTCQTTSNPPASYSWTKQSGDLPDDAREETVDQTSVLVIPSLTKDHSGTYICTASNILLPGGTTKEYNLNVLCESAKIT
ncbi:nephrin-like [Branchiostoma floridae x Branchiostoma japonicum]